MGSVHFISQRTPSHVADYDRGTMVWCPQHCGVGTLPPSLPMSEGEVLPLLKNVEEDRSWMKFQ